MKLSDYTQQRQANQKGNGLGAWWPQRSFMQSNACGMRLKYYNSRELLWH